jgi:hypothetical protein
MDQSSGARQIVNDGKLSIVPAIADEYMSEWMQYLYMNKPMPDNANGVPVKIEAIDADGNSFTIGTTTSDVNGNYGIIWNPPHEGIFTIVATFEGSETYWSSFATAKLGVGAASDAASSSPTPIPNTDALAGVGPVDAYIIVAVAAIFLKKRK